MNKVIPAIITKKFSEIKEKIHLVENEVDWVQIDVADGIFVPNTTWSNPWELKKIKSKVKIEAHLMIKNPQKMIKDWLAIVDRVIIHFEAVNLENFPLNPKIGIALNPETPWEKIEKFLPKISLVTFMTVNPGFSGQKFLPSVLPKISSFHQKYPNFKIEVDGGINLDNGKKALKAGASFLVANSFIFQSKNIKKAIEALNKLSPLPSD